MEQNTESQPHWSAHPITKKMLLFSSLGITLLTISLYLLFSELVNWLPEAHGDSLLDWAGPLKGLPPEGIWAVQNIILRILACALGLLLLHRIVKLFFGRRLYLPFRRITKLHRNSLAKNTIFYFVLFITLDILFSVFNLWRFVEGPEIQTAPIGLLGTFLLFFFVAAAAPFFEEALFRGFLYTRLRFIFSFWPAFLISGMFFSLLHFDPQGSAAYNAFNIFHALIFSYFVTKTFEESGNLWNSIILHGIYNGWVLIVLTLSDIIESLAIPL